jgi:hypothetical protein
MSRRTSRALALVVPTLCFMVVSVSAASASTVYVSNSAPVVAGGKSCAQPAASTVKAGIVAAAGGTVDICSGTYTEQIEISTGVKLKAVNGVGTATLAMPSNPATATSSCDTKEGLAQKDEISICAAGTVSITGVNVEAIVPLETCGFGLNGIFVAGGATLDATSMSIDGASSSLNSFKGCQHGIAVDVGSASHNEVGHASLKSVTVDGYEKNGPTVSGAGSTLAITNSTITGEGPSPYIGQNGIEVAFGGKGNIKSTTVSGNECNVGSCGAEAEQASGVLFYEAAPASNVTSSKIEENDLGVYYAAGESNPSSPDVTVSKNVLTSNRYEGVELEEGKASLSKDTINGSGRVGIDLFQYEGQFSASESAATKMTISGQSEAAIKVESDKKAGDIPGTFTITNSTETGNGQLLINDSNNFAVIF